MCMFARIIDTYLHLIASHHIIPPQSLDVTNISPVFTSFPYVDHWNSSSVSKYPCLFFAPAPFWHCFHICLSKCLFSAFCPKLHLIGSNISRVFTVFSNSSSTEIMKQPKAMSILDQKCFLGEVARISSKLISFSWIYVGYVFPDAQVLVIVTLNCIHQPPPPLNVYVRSNELHLFTLQHIIPTTYI